jgi:hypothetical protein
MKTIDKIPENLRQYFKKLHGKWYVIILSVYYISDGFSTLLEAVNHLIKINNDFENSKEFNELKNKIDRYK